MEDGADRARRSTSSGDPRSVSVQDLLARHGPPRPGRDGRPGPDAGHPVAGGRAARRRAAEEQASTPLDRPPNDRPTDGADLGPTSGAPDRPGAGGPPAGRPPRSGRVDTATVATTTIAPRAAAPPTGGPRVGGPPTAGPRVGGPPTGGPRAGGPRVSGPRVGGPTTAAPGTAATAARFTAPDHSERAELTRRVERTAASAARAARVDDTLSRITAAHAGLALPRDPSADSDQVVTAQPRRRAGVLLGKFLVAALALAVLATTAFGWTARTRLDAAVSTVAALDPDSGVIVDAAGQRGDDNLLIVAGEPTRSGGATARPPTMLVAHEPANGGPTVVVSFPPDLEIDRPECERWDADSRSYLDRTVPAQARTPLADAFDVGGPRCLTRVVQQLSGIAVTGFVGMDVGALGTAADTLGGVPVCVPFPVLDGALGPVVPEAGETTLDGLRAADFARAAEVRGDPPADRGRIERQQLLLAGVLGRMVAGAAALDGEQLAAAEPALGRALLTDGVDMDALLALTRSLRDLEADGITFAAVPTAAPTGTGRTVLRGTDASTLFAAVRAGTPLPAQSDDPVAAAPTPGELTITVRNATDRTGLGAEVADTLRSLGFGVGKVGTAEQATPQTIIRFSPDQSARAALLALTVPSATSVPDPGATGVLELVLGRSFDDVLRPPGGAAADPPAPPVDAVPERTSCR